MPRPSRRTRGVRKVEVKTPGGRSAVHHRKKKTRPTSCWMCGRPLSGVPRVRPARLKSLARSSRKPNRPFGGNLCPACSRRLLKERVWAR